jgi:hypothetical protein
VFEFLCGEYEGRKMKSQHALRMVGAAAVLSLAFGTALPANASYFFTGTGSNGNFSGQASEPYTYNFDFQFGGTQNDWGSPGVSNSLTPYLETDSAFGFQITFTGATIDPNSILVGNSAACAGTTTGGTTFCSNSLNPWQAFSLGSNSIEFLAPTTSDFVSTGTDFFVNVFFAGDLPTGFSGEWITDFTPAPTPLPGALPLLASGLGALGLLGWRRKRKVAAVTASG